MIVKPTLSNTVMQAVGRFAPTIDRPNREAAQ
jgi:hypothetical protein